MKNLKIITVFLTILLTGVSVSNAQSTNQNDSLKKFLQTEFSLFYEYHKNHDFNSAYPHGWNVINNDPTDYIKYKVFKRMDDILWFLRDSVETSDAEKKKIQDTALYFYDRAAQFEPDKKADYLAKKAYILEIWHNAPVPALVSAYEAALTADSQIPSFYRDRLGLIYSANDDGANNFKTKAIQLYSNLTQEDPENPLWPERIKKLADDPEQLIEIYKKVWDLDKENLEKAWGYAATCIRYEKWEKAVEPLEFLTSKSPDVVNYHKRLAQAYEKTDQTNKAVNEYNTLIKLEPENRDNYANLAIVYQKQGQFSVSRSYLQKASNADPKWDFPYYLEAQLYESAARNCGFEFMDKCVYQLAVDTYNKARSMGGEYSSSAAERMRALSNSVPTKEDYFFRKLSSGTTIKIEGNCYGWIGRSIVVP